MFSCNSKHHKSVAMEKSKNFRIDALLAEEPHRGTREVSPGLSSDSPTGSPVSCRRAETPSPRGTPGLIHLQTGIIPKPGLLSLPHPGLTSLPGMYTTPMYPISALGGQHPALAYSVLRSWRSRTRSSWRRRRWPDLYRWSTGYERASWYHDCPITPVSGVEFRWVGNNLLSL